MTDILFTNFRKSARSNPSDSCVAVDTTSQPHLIGVRDTKLGERSPTLVFTAADWAAFLSDTKIGTFIA